MYNGSSCDMNDRVYVYVNFLCVWMFLHDYAIEDRDQNDCHVVYKTLNTE